MNQIHILQNGTRKGRNLCSNNNSMMIEPKNEIFSEKPHLSINQTSSGRENFSYIWSKLYHFSLWKKCLFTLEDNFQLCVFGKFLELLKHWRSYINHVSVVKANTNWIGLSCFFGWFMDVHSFLPYSQHCMHVSNLSDLSLFPQKSIYFKQKPDGQTC